MFRAARVGAGRECRGEDRLRDSVARRTRERDTIARHGGIDGVAEWPQDIALHGLILTDEAPEGQVGARYRHHPSDDYAPIDGTGQRKAVHGATIG
jgi:hypothetical protein